MSIQCELFKRDSVTGTAGTEKVGAAGCSKSRLRGTEGRLCRGPGTVSRLLPTCLSGLAHAGQTKGFRAAGEVSLPGGGFIYLTWGSCFLGV